MSKFLPYGTQAIDAADVRAVVRVLGSGRLTQGPEIERFEEAFAKAVGAPYAVAVSSGTAGLHLACLAAGIKRGDEMITSPLSFVATSNAVLYAGGTPRFADIHERTLGMDPVLARKMIGPRTRGFLPVHFAGQPAPVRFGRGIVIEDACHALGAEVNDGRGWKKIGACHDSDMAVFSFHPVKHIATGEGGMVTTRRKDLYERLKLLRSHGIEKKPDVAPWYYEMTRLGYNYRITDIQCALGTSQLKKLSRFVRRRREIAAFYARAFRGVDVIKTPDTIPGTRPSFHLYVLKIDFKRIGFSRAELMKRLFRRGIGTQVHYIPIPSQPYYRKNFKFRGADFPRTEKYYDEALSIPMYPAMKDADCRRVAHTVLALCSKNF